ncbi:MAG TPA: ceramidase domain-containing protein [Verrucomicrobiae bacterium]|nr:ceramidase domain-containing protein [Verrucomicrobiae bacterium]
MNATPNVARLWRPGLVLLLVAGSLALLLTHKPIAQDPHYHDFADGRTLLGVPSFWNVISNVPFLFVGVAGLVLCLRRRFVGASACWTVFFIAVALVSVGSAYYHWRPSNDTLVWDRLPMTIGFMAMFVALLSESINEKLGSSLLVPAVLVGLFSVVYWHLFDDLRIYAWVQFMPLLTIPVVLALYRS